MSAQQTLIGDILELKRESIEIETGKTYRRIGIYSWGKGMIHRPPAPATDMGSLRYFSFPTSALVLSNIQAWEAALAVSTIDESANFVCSNRFLPYMPKDTARVDVRYLWHYFLSDDGILSLRTASPGTQVRNRTLGKALFEAIEVPLPDLPEQRRIVGYLDSVAATATHVARSVDECIRQGGSLLEQVVQDRGAARRPIGDLLERDRAWMTLEDSQVYAPVGVRGFNRGIIHYPPTPRAELSKLRYYRLRPNRLLVSNIKAWEGAVTLTGLKDKGRIASNRFLQYECASSDILLPYLHRYLVSSEGINQLQTASPGSADRNRTLSIESFESIQVPVPDLEIQRRITMTGSLVEKLFAVARSKARIAGALLPAARNEVFSAMR